MWEALTFAPTAGPKEIFETFLLWAVILVPALYGATNYFDTSITEDKKRERYNWKQHALLAFLCGPIVWICLFITLTCGGGGAAHKWLNNWLSDEAGIARAMDKADRASAAARVDTDRTEELLAEIERLQQESINNIRASEPKAKRKRAK